MPRITPEEFADRLSEIMPVIMKEFVRRHSRDVYRLQVTPPQFLVMDFIYKREEARMKDLAQFMSVAMATMTGIVERLVRHGYVKRVPDKQDRRIIKVRMTSQGEILMKRILKRRREVLIHVFSKISAADREEYLRILTRIRDVLLQEPLPEKA